MGRFDSPDIVYADNPSPQYLMPNHQLVRTSLWETSRARTVEPEATCLGGVGAAERDAQTGPRRRTRPIRKFISAG